MKFRNSYLLIVIAIFLLISIGSVCASENITDNSDVQLADDGTDVVLSDTDDNVPDETSEEQINTTVETDSDNYEFRQDSTNKTVTVTVKDNKTNIPIDVNKSSLSVMNKDKNISFEYTSSAITITENLPYGNYNLTINYLGNGTYINSSKVIAVKIYGNNTIETVTSVVVNSVNIEVPVNVTDHADYIELVKDNFNLTLVYTNETGNITNLTITDFDVVNDTIKFQTNVNLIGARLIVNYVNATEPKTVDIKIGTQVKAETDKDKFKSEEIKNISIKVLDYKGNQLNVSKNDLKVFNNGTEIAFTLNGTNMTVELGIGVHNLTIEYQGNDTYNASSTNITIKVSGNNTIIVPEYVVSDGTTVIIPVTVFDGADNLTADEFKLNLTYTNKTGNVASVIITPYSFADGKITFDVSAYKWIQASVNISYVNATESKTVRILLNSTVVAVPPEDKYRENEVNNITVTVKDNAGNPLIIKKDDLEVYDNGKLIAFTYNTTSSILNLNLEIGVHNLTIVYKGNNTFNSSKTTIERKVYGDNKLEPNAFVVLSSDKKVIITLNLNDGADLVEVNETKLNITLFWTYNNQTHNKTISAYTVSGEKNQNLTFEVSEQIDSAHVYIKYDNLNATVNIKVNTTINATDLYYGESQVKNFTIKVTADNGYPINITKDNIQVLLANGTALKIDVNNSVIIIKDALKFGVYNLTIKYLGTDSLSASSKDIKLTIYGINATTPVNVNSTIKGEVKIEIVSGNTTIPIALDDLKLNVTYKKGNDTIEIRVNPLKYENGTLYFKLENGNFTTATLNIKYDQTEANVTLNRIYNANIIPITIVNDYQDGNFTFKLIDVDTGDLLVNKTVSLTMNQNGTSIYFITHSAGGGYSISSTITLTSDANGIVTLANKDFYPGLVLSDNIFAPVGEYVATITGSGVVKGTNKTNITINMIDVRIVLEPFNEYYGTDKKVTITVTNAKTGKALPGVYILLNITGATLSTPRQITNENGTIQLGVNGLPTGTYQMVFETNDTNLNGFKSSGSFNINKIPVTISAKNVNIYFNTGVTSTITVKQNGKPLSGMYLLVRIYTTSKKYKDYLFQTNSKGQISFSASLSVGKHKVIISSADTRYSASQVTKTITVKKASAKITAKKVTAYYKGGKYLTVKLTNTKNKKPIYDAKINIKIYVSKNRYYNYNGKTGMNGQIKLLVDSLKPGTYKVVVSGADSKNFKASKVTTKVIVKKAPTKLVPKKLTAKKGAKKYFKVTVKNKKTKKVISGVKIKVKVYTGKKSKTYSVKSNAKGVAKLNVEKIKVGKHKVIVRSANKYCVAKQVKSSIKITK